jgi:hypothetical protein
MMEHLCVVGGLVPSLIIDRQVASLPRGRAVRILGEVREVVSGWTDAARAQVASEHVRRIAPALRLTFARG